MALMRNVAVDDYFEVEIKIIAPVIQGKHLLGLRLRDEHGQLFGETVWCNFIVEEQGSFALKDIKEMNEDVADVAFYQPYFAPPL